MSDLYAFATTPVFFITPYQLLWSVLNPAILLALLRTFKLAPSRRAAVTAAVATGIAVLLFNWTIEMNGTAGPLNHDAPILIFPISWADFFDGLSAIAVNALVLGFGPMRQATGQAVARMALLAGVVVLLTDVFLF